MRRWLAWLLSMAMLVWGMAPTALATSNDTNLNVTLTIPDSSSGGGGQNEPPPTDNDPSISNVLVEVTTSSAHITWSASDDSGINTVVLKYGLTTSYGTNANVSGNYEASLTNLADATTYYYQISVTDTGLHTVTYSGNFTTETAADVTPPVISNVTSTPNVTTCTISWSVNESASGQVLYGLTTDYGSTKNTDTGLSHTTILNGLVPSSTYHFKIIATDTSNNSVGTNDATCRTLADVTPPANPSNFALSTTTNSFIITWVNPLDADFTGVKLVKKTASAPATVSDGTLVYNGSGSTFTDTSITTNVTYYYTIFAYDSSGNHSSGANTEGRLTTPVVVNEICNNGIDDNSNGQTDCNDTACTAQAMCQIVVENCSNGVDDDSNGRIDCDDSFCSGANYCTIKNTTEICDNNIDDNSNGLVDCDEGSCFAFPSCSSGGTVVNVPTSTTSGPAQLSINDLFFLGGNRATSLSVQGTTITGLAGAHYSVGLRLSSLPQQPQRVLLHIANSTYQFSLESNTYYSDIMFPPIGTHQAYVEVVYDDNNRDTIEYQVQSLGYGLVQSGSQAVSSAEITLLNETGSLVDVRLLSNTNPFITNENGVYGWMVPNGKYQIRATKADYYDRITPVFSVENNVVNLSVDLIARPPDLFENITVSSTVTETITQVTKNVAAKTKAAALQTVEKAKDVAKAVEEIKKDPEVQKAASQVVAPTAVTVAAVSTVAFVSWTDLIPLLRLLFLQPVMLLGKRRRKGWGQVYNALNKIPVDLATIRLLSDGKVIQSKVTDKEGRYAFVVNPGKYTIQVMKNGFTFPSSLLSKSKSDGRHADIYHGEIIEVTEKEAVITANIPLDPIGEAKKPVRIFWQKIGRVVQLSMSWAGILVTLASLYISPKWYVWALLVVHIVLFIVFRRLAVPAKIKSWGIVYDSESKKPVGRTVARLFNSEFNKLVATQITDGSGRYYFLAGDDKYYVTYDHPQYSAEKTTVLDLTGKDVETITIDVGLNKRGPLPPTPPAAPAAV